MKKARLEHTERWILAHDPSECSGQACSLHNRSDHHMRHWAQHWRDDRGLMERICPHGVGHPDPDHFEFIRRTRGDEVAWIEGIHGCDSCCVIAKSVFEFDPSNSTRVDTIEEALK